MAGNTAITNIHLATKREEYYEVSHIQSNTFRMKVQYTQIHVFVQIVVMN